MHAVKGTTSSTDILDFLTVPNLDTYADVLAYIARTRRQLDRFEHLPECRKWTIEPDKAARLRAMCDELEADIRKKLAEV